MPNCCLVTVPVFLFKVKYKKQTTDNNNNNDVLLNEKKRRKKREGNRKNLYHFVVWCKKIYLESILCASVNKSVYSWTYIKQLIYNVSLTYMNMTKTSRLEQEALSSKNDVWSDFWKFLGDIFGDIFSAHS